MREPGPAGHTMPKNPNNYVLSLIAVRPCHRTWFVPIAVIIWGGKSSRRKLEKPPLRRKQTLSRIAFLFPGQGAQTVGMGKRLYELLPAVRQFTIAQGNLGYDLAKLCFEGPADNSTRPFQPASLFVTSLAALESLRAESPDVVLAARLGRAQPGEYTAMVFAGVMDFESGLTLVQQRGAAMQNASDATPSGMVSILGLEQVQIEALIEKVRGDEILQIANLLCPGNIAISGLNGACERAAEAAQAFGAMKAVPLAVAGSIPYPNHAPGRRSSERGPAAVRMENPKILSSPTSTPAPPGSRGDTPVAGKANLEPVLWEDSMRYLISQGFDQFYEVGPGRVLRGLLCRIDRKVSCQSVEV